eukprot:Gregarina_sp_Poly_1__5218@NODE_2767_length_1746_cov_40_184038_g1746_i0_p2_GENE_NODE_2767_length_1746_cov_40_184038_g1746_i0NODE_2767_length_1746_cov_40_184038_g1746_i0_p2_ORF_typecomplete_len179_score17_85_NODE_2767_length_1746_cov_40_184038_g1746_i07901326
MAVAGFLFVAVLSLVIFGCPLSRDSWSYEGSDSPYTCNAALHTPISLSFLLLNARSVEMTVCLDQEKVNLTARIVTRDDCDPHSHVGFLAIDKKPPEIRVDRRATSSEIAKNYATDFALYLKEHAVPALVGIAYVQGAAGTTLPDKLIITWLEDDVQIRHTNFERSSVVSLAGEMSRD